MTKNCRPPKLVDGIFEGFLALVKILWVKQIVCIKNGFVLTDFLQNKQFCVVRTGPYYKFFFLYNVGQLMKTVRLVQLNCVWSGRKWFDY